MSEPLREKALSLSKPWQPSTLHLSTLHSSTPPEQALGSGPCPGCSLAPRGAHHCGGRSRHRPCGLGEQAVPGASGFSALKGPEHKGPFGVLLVSFTYSPLPGFRGKDLPAIPGLAHLTKHPVHLSLTHVSHSSLNSPRRAPGGVQRLRIHRLHLIHGKKRLCHSPGSCCLGTALGLSRNSLESCSCSRICLTTPRQIYL